LSFIICANSLATVVFAVPGEPVNTICMEGRLSVHTVIRAGTKMALFDQRKVVQ